MSNPLRLVLLCLSLSLVPSCLVATDDDEEPNVEDCQADCEDAHAACVLDCGETNISCVGECDSTLTACLNTCG
ncbi:MAG TPA: hypothetical protein VIM73_14895 [Polyangiaceae bacterium]